TADLQRAQRAAERVDDLDVTLVRYEDPTLRAAHLAVVHHAALHELVEQGIVEIHVVEHDRGRLAAALQRAALELRAAQLTDAHAGRGGAAEAHLDDVGMLHAVPTRLSPRGPA